MIPRPRKVRRLRRVRRLAMWCPSRMTMLAPVWSQSALRAFQADPFMQAAVQAFVDRMAAKKAAERAAFEARKQARRVHVDPR